MKRAALEYALALLTALSLIVAMSKCAGCDSAVFHSEGAASYEPATNSVSEVCK